MKKNSPELTKEQELRLLDLKIAQRVFAAKYCGKPRGNGYWEGGSWILWRTVRGNLESHPTNHLPRYSEDIFSAMLVVEALRKRGIMATLMNWSYYGRLSYTAKFRNSDLNQEWEERADSWPEAICKAALSALSE